MDREKERKIVRTRDSGNLLDKEYQCLKPDGDDGWKRHGRHYGIRGVDTLVGGNTFYFEVADEVKTDLELYEQFKVEQKRQFTSRKKLEVVVTQN